MKKESEGAARGFVCATHGEFVQPGAECRYCEKSPSINARACKHPYTFMLIRDGKDYVCGVCDVAMLPTPEAERVPLMNLDACGGCGRSGLELMQSGETYKTHACYRAVASNASPPKAAP